MRLSERTSHREALSKNPVAMEIICLKDHLIICSLERPFERSSNSLPMGLERGSLKGILQTGPVKIRKEDAQKRSHSVGVIVVTIRW